MPDDTVYAMKVAPPGGGCHLTVGPVTFMQGVDLVEEHLAPNGWTVNSIGLLEPDRLVNIVARVPSPAPTFGADLFVALRRAAVADAELGDGDGADSPRFARLMMHLDSHRPTAQWTADSPECWDGECEHEPAPDGGCSTTKLARLICATCSPMYDPGGAWDHYPLEPGRIAWPCEPVRTIAAYYKVPIDAEVVRGGS